MLTGGVTIACVLPYTTAVKGHVAVEYFFLKLPRTARIVVDTATRLVCMAVLGVLSWRCVLRGMSLQRSNTVSQTLQIPSYYLAYVAALSCALVVLVIFHNLLHPGREMIKP